MLYSSGIDFERALFDTRSEGLKLKGKYNGQPDDFGFDVSKLLTEVLTNHPSTPLGTSIHHHVSKQLLACGVDPTGLVFASTVNTKVDAFYQTDGVFFLPALYPHVVTVDAFLTSDHYLKVLRGIWEDSFIGDRYTDVDFQSDLYRHKRGYALCPRDLKNSSKLFGRVVDFRPYSSCRRPENHFVLTPSMVRDYPEKKSFAKLIAGYFVQVSGSHVPETRYKKPDF